MSDYNGVPHDKRNVSKCTRLYSQKLSKKNESFYLGNVILNVITDMGRKSKLSLEKAEHLTKRFLLFHHMLSDSLSDYTEKSAISLASIKFAVMIYLCQYWFFPLGATNQAHVCKNFMGKFNLHQTKIFREAKIINNSN